MTVVQTSRPATFAADIPEEMPPTAYIGIVKKGALSPANIPPASPPPPPPPPAQDAPNSPARPEAGSPAPPASPYPPAPTQP
ncbi:unnamed protein product, partial [Cylicostephanus goldi]